MWLGTSAHGGASPRYSGGGPAFRISWRSGSTCRLQSDWNCEPGAWAELIAAFEGR